MDKIRVLLLNRDVAVRASLIRLLEQEADLEVREGPDGRPDVVVLSVSDAGQPARVREAFPTSRILGRVSVLHPELRECRELDATLDSVAPYDVLLRAIRDLGQRQASPHAGAPARPRADH
jgi:hypothetical protein